MTDRELTQRITDYLTGGGLFNPEMANHEAVRDLLIDCRDALAQPKIPMSPEHLPQYIATNNIKPTTEGGGGGGGTQPEQDAVNQNDCGHKEYKPLCQMCVSKKQPEQEPVAYLNIEIEGTGGYLDWDNDIPASWYKSIPLYTAPPKREWVGLTHDDIENLWNGVQWSISDFVIPFTRAVEAKLKEKNGAI